jgi:hypothetical protein
MYFTANTCRALEAREAFGASSNFVVAGAEVP